MKNITQLFDNAQKPLNDIRAKIEAIELRLAELKHAPLDKSESKAQAAQWIERKAAKGREMLKIAAKYLEYPNAGLISVLPYCENQNPQHAVEQLENVLFALHGETIAATIHDFMDDIPNRLNRESVSDDIQKLNAELAQLEIVEEKTIRELEDSGYPAERRGMANPAVVLRGELC